MSYSPPNPSNPAQGATAPRMLHQKARILSWRHLKAKIDWDQPGKSIPQTGAAWRKAPVTVTKFDPWSPAHQCDVRWWSHGGLLTFHTLEVSWCQTINHLKAHQEYFELNPMSNRKPVEIFRDSGDVVMLLWSAQGPDCPEIKVFNYSVCFSWKSWPRLENLLAKERPLARTSFIPEISVQ
jgi:hypothetical protein